MNDISFNSQPARVMSVSEFRANIASVYEQFLAPTSFKPGEVWVKDLKQNQILFKVVPAFALPTNQVEVFNQYLRALEKTRGQLKLNTQRINQVRSSFADRLKNPTT